MTNRQTDKIKAMTHIIRRIIKEVILRIPTRITLSSNSKIHTVNKIKGIITTMRRTDKIRIPTTLSRIHISNSRILISRTAVIHIISKISLSRAI